MQAFLDGRLRFTAIPEVIESTLAAHAVRPADSLEAVLAEDTSARRHAEALVERSGDARA